MNSECFKNNRREVICEVVSELNNPELFKLVSLFPSMNSYACDMNESQKFNIFFNTFNRAIKFGEHCDIDFTELSDNTHAQLLPIDYIELIVDLALMFDIFRRSYDEINDDNELAQCLTMDSGSLNFPGIGEINTYMVLEPISISIYRLTEPLNTIKSNIIHYAMRELECHLFELILKLLCKYYEE